MNLIPNSNQKGSMLKDIKLNNIEELFADIPKQIKINKINLPKGLTQQEVEQKIRAIGEKNQSCYNMPCFLGGGIKPHYIPAIVKSISSRSEFYTSYTPYQTEASQGFLQAIFEYQSIIAKLTGMDIANASLYDGMTALGEAALMCNRINKKKSFLIPENTSWEKKSILHNYTKGHDIEIIEIPYDKNTGKLDLTTLKQEINEDVSGIYIENPNFFGIFEDRVDEIETIIHSYGALFIVGIDPLTLGIIRNPGEYGADIALGEGRALGNGMEFGGSSLGLFACKKEFLRQLPGRVIGITKDNQDNRAFCMTLQTREQHIRRGRATSNICTNEGLCALASCVFLSWLGSNGLQKLGETNLEQATLLEKKINTLKEYNLRFTGSHFNEMVIQCPCKVEQVNKTLLNNDVIGGLSLEQRHPELKNCMLIGVTEMHSEEDINKFISGLKEAI